jgi:hypothetical protein
MPRVETIKRVQPGQVISSALMNEILERLQKIGVGESTGDLTSIQSELQALETWQKSVDPQISAINKTLSDVEAKLMSIGTTPQVEEKVRITGFEPPDSCPTGQVMTILGDNFAPNPFENVVVLRNIPVDEFRPDSTLNRLKFIVPTSLPSGKVTVYVSNCNGEAHADYTLSAPTNVNTPKITDVHSKKEHTRGVLYINEEFTVDGLNLDPVNVIFAVMTEFGPVSYAAPYGGFNVVPNIREIKEVSTDPSKAVPVILEVQNRTAPSAMVRVQVLRTQLVP